MTNVTLPPEVVREDRQLDETKEGAAEKLMKLRWHWTKDETNAERVTTRDYAEAVGKSQTAIQRDVKAYEILNTVPCSDPRGKPSPQDAREKAVMSAETAAVTEAVANARGIGVGTARQHHKETVKRVRNLARDLAEQKGTTVEEEAPAIAEDIVASGKADRKLEERAKAMGMDCAEIETLLRKARSGLSDALTIAKNTQFNDDEAESLEDDLTKLRATLSLLEMAISGTTMIDWDQELEKIGA